MCTYKKLFNNRDKRGVGLQKGVGAGGGCAPSLAKCGSFEINVLKQLKKLHRVGNLHSKKIIR